jgi:hypothetical protein
MQHMISSTLSILPFAPFPRLGTFVVMSQVVTEATVEDHIRRLAAVLLRRIMIDDENSIYNQLDFERSVIFTLYLVREN